MDEEVVLENERLAQVSNRKVASLHDDAQTVLD